MDRIKNRFNLEGKVAIVTGSSKGIGEAIARGLAEFGAKVIVSSRKQDAVDEVAAAFKADGLEAHGIACHVGDEEQLKALVEGTIEKYGGVDILVNNAATNPFFGPLTQVDGATFEKIMNTNVKSCHLLGNMVHPIMKSRGGGSIINISSVGGLKAPDMIAIYGVSKAALIMLTQVQAKEWGPDGVRVNAICPGLIKTKFSAALWQNEQMLKAVERNFPSRRIGEADEIAGMAVFLASDASSYSTGGAFTADGGLLLAG
ncbi:MAG: glucose 1-dehydrogenase [Bacteroidota bacterium]